MSTNRSAQNTRSKLSLPQKSQHAYDSLVPDWLHLLGTKLNLGILIILENRKVFFSNSQALEHLELPPLISNDKSNFDNWLNFMVERGDFGNGEPNELKSKLQKSIFGNSLEKIDTVTPPNSRTIKLKALTASAGFTTVFTEDITALTNSEDTLNLAMKIGRSGYFHYCLDTDEFTVYSQHVRSLLTDKEADIVEEKGFWPLIHHDDIETAKTEWKGIIRDHTNGECNVRLNTELHGPIWIKFTMHTQHHPSSRAKMVIGFFEDITTEREREAELIENKEKTESALRSKTEFLGRISHEIRTPMNAVIGIADALIYHNSNPAIVPKLELIQSSAGNILNILDDTLNHSKLDSNEFTIDPKAANPGQTIQSVCSLWELKAKANNAVIRCHIDESVPDEIIFDRYRYEQCLNNLLSNAIKFSPDGRIDVICTRIHKNGEARLVVAVKDTGIGMTSEQKARIFEAFQQGDKSISRRFGGTGLGMNITKRIIELMGGTISVKSELGKGSIFALSIPIVQDLPDSISASNQLFNDMMQKKEASSSPYEKLKILVADDNPTNHTVIRSLLDSMVAEIYTADHGQDVLNILETKDVDIILMDIHMPIMDGVETTLAIRKSDKPWSDVLIIAVTADPQYQQKRLCLNIGMDHAVAKPVKLIDLLQAIDDVVAIREKRNTAPLELSA